MNRFVAGDCEIFGFKQGLGLGFLVILVVLITPGMIIAQRKAVDSTILSGRLEGVDSGTMQIRLDNWATGSQTFYEEVKHSRFTFRTSLTEPVFAEFIVGNRTFYGYLDPGAKMKLSIPAEPNSFLKIEGSLTNESYLLRRRIRDSLSVVHIGIKDTAAEAMSFYSDSLFLITSPVTYYSMVILNLNFHEISILAIDSILRVTPPLLRQSNLYLRLLKRLQQRKPEYKVGDKISDFTWLGADKKILHFQNVADTSTLIILDFWESSCLPCRKNLPFLKSLISDYSSQGLIIVTISIDHDSLKWENAIFKDCLDNVINILDNPSTRIAERFSIEDVPAYFLIDKKLNVIGRFSGNEVGKAKMEGMIREVFAKQNSRNKSGHVD